MLQYSWTNSTINSSVITACPSSTTTYFLTVNDNIQHHKLLSNYNVVNTPPIAQSNIDICQTGLPIYLNAQVVGFGGTGIISSSGVFPQMACHRLYDVNYEFLDVQILQQSVGKLILDISACVNAPTFNLNTIYYVWRNKVSRSCIQPNFALHV